MGHPEYLHEDYLLHFHFFFAPWHLCVFALNSIAGSQAEAVTNGGFNLLQGRPGNFSGAHAHEPAGIQSTKLETKKDGFHRQAAFGGWNTDVGGVIARHIFALRANDDRDDERQPVDGVDGENQNGPMPRLLPALHRVEVDQIDVAALDGHQSFPKPSDSAAANSALMECNSRWICGSFAMAAS